MEVLFQTQFLFLFKQFYRFPDTFHPGFRPRGNVYPANETFPVVWCQCIKKDCCLFVSGQGLLHFSGYSEGDLWRFGSLIE